MLKYENHPYNWRLVSLEIFLKKQMSPVSPSLESLLTYFTAERVACRSGGTNKVDGDEAGASEMKMSQTEWRLGACTRGKVTEYILDRRLTRVVSRPFLAAPPQ